MKGEKQWVAGLQGLLRKKTLIDEINSKGGIEALSMDELGSISGGVVEVTI